MSLFEAFHGSLGVFSKSREVVVKELGWILRTAVVSYFLIFSAQFLHGQNCKEMAYGHEIKLTPVQLSCGKLKGKFWTRAGPRCLKSALGFLQNQNTNSFGTPKQMKLGYSH
jgi:hypothetical protein